MMRISDIKIGNRIRIDIGNLADLKDSIKRFGLLHPIVVNENNSKSKTNLKSKNQMKDIRFVESMRDLDESAFDRIICFYWEGLFYPTPEQAMNKLIESGDNKSLVLVSGIPDGKDKKSNGVLRFKKEHFEEYIESKGICDYWFVDRNNEEKFDIIFKIIKWSVS